MREFSIWGSSIVPFLLEPLAHSALGNNPMVSVKVMGPTRKAVIQRDSQFSLSSIPMGIEALSDAVGSEATYVRHVTFRAENEMYLCK